MSEKDQEHRFRCEDCGFIGSYKDFSYCEVCKDHGFCPKCNGIVMWESICEVDHKSKK